MGFFVYNIHFHIYANQTPGLQNLQTCLGMLN